MLIQLAAPYLMLPMTSVMPSSTMAAPAMSQRIFLARSRSRRNTPSTRKSTRPSTMAISCLKRAWGAEEAVTARERVQRKKAMSSISKPTRRRQRSRRK